MKMKKILMIVGLVVVVGGTAAGGFLMGKGKGSDAPGDHDDVSSEIAADARGEGDAEGAKANESHGKSGGHGSEEGAEAAAKREGPYIYQFEKFITNLSDNLSTFVQVTVEVETATEEGLELIERNLAPLRDATLMLLSSKTTSDLTPAGWERLKRELLARYQGVLNDTRQIRDVYLTQRQIVPY